MILFRLGLLTLWVRKTWVLILGALLLLPFLLPYITPIEEAPQLVQPARAQAAWSMLWLTGILWVLSQGARLGDGNSRTGVGNLLRSMKIGKLRQLLSLWSALMLYLVPMVIVATLVSLLAAMPGAAEEKGIWIATNLQYALLFLLTMAPLAMLAIALASRFGAMVGFVLPVALCLYGLYGVNHLGETIKMGGNPVLEWLYILSPHYCLADLTPRLLFKMGALTTGDFVTYGTYFVVVGVGLLGVSRLLFRTEPLQS